MKLLFFIQGMKYISLIILISISLSAFSQKVTLKGEQKINNTTNNPVLECTPLKISATMKISETEGDCEGFWIEKGSETIHKFKKNKDAIGVLLQPGTYYVYPYLKTNQKKSYIIITLHN